MASTILLSFFGVMFAGKAQISGYCNNYYKHSYAMKYLAMVSPIVFGHIETILTKSNLTLLEKEKMESYNR